MKHDFSMRTNRRYRSEFSASDSYWRFIGFITSSSHHRPTSDGLRSRTRGESEEFAVGRTTSPDDYTPRFHVKYREKRHDRETAVSRILTAAPIWEGCASKKALRGLIIDLPPVSSRRSPPLRGSKRTKRDTR